MEVRKLSRRTFLKLGSLAVAGTVLSACAPSTPTPAVVQSTNTPLPPPATYTPAPTAAAVTNTPMAATNTPAAVATATTAPVGGATNAWGVTLPSDAAALEQQFIRIIAIEGTAVDFPVTVYKRTSPAYCDILATTLVRINKNFEIVANGATSWEVTPDGKTWTFHLDPAIKWNDGTPLTADDYVFTFQYQADPKHAWDFAWFWSDVVNFSDAVAGKVATTEVGVKAVDATTLQFMTSVPSPYFPSKALYARPLSKVAFQKSGELYNTSPDTSVSSSPWKLKEWTKGKQMVFEPNTAYTGKLKPYLENLILIFGDNSTEFNAYQNNEIDEADTFSPANIATISADSALNSQYHPSFGDFRTYYLGFGTSAKPFNDLKVREAFAKAIDRDSIIKNIVGRQGIPAYSFLMPGFPDSTSDVLKNDDVNKFDVTAAQKLLSDAGYPNGQGFPAQEMWLRQENQFNQSIAEAIAAMLSQNLNIQVSVSNKETKLFTDTLNSHKLPFYYVSYGFDYLDPSNMLGIWVTGGRHDWTNAQFDTLVKEATSLIGDTAKRDQEFKDAEKILVDDVGGVFIYHVTPGNIYKPYLVGEELSADKTGVAAWHWPGLEDIGVLMSTVYISKDAPSDRHM
jgi:ABC-type oligopeptide transport system substrate-binding subunit